MKNHAKIDDFLTCLRKELRELPTNKQDDLIQEFYDHIYTEIEEKKAVGLDEEIAIEETLKNFEHEQISLINREYLESQKNNFEGGRDYPFDFTMLCIIGGLFGLTEPLRSQDMVSASILASLLLYLPGMSVLLFYYGKRMNESRMKWVQTTSKFLIPLLSLPFIFYVYILNKIGEITAFPTIYLVIYVVFYLMTYFALRRLYNKNRVILETTGV